MPAPAATEEELNRLIAERDVKLLRRTGDGYVVAGRREWPAVVSPLDVLSFVMSLRNGGGVFWVRANMYVLYDPYTLATTNEYRYIADERVALSVPRPAAVNLISDLAGTS